jgi:hypothetical protein
MQLWRRQARGAVDEAHLAATLLPPTAQDIPDTAHWRSVRDRVEQAGGSLERVSAIAPTEETADATRRTASSLRGLFFALDSNRLLRDGAVQPTPEQLLEADSAIRAREGELAGALAHLDRLITPPQT